MRPTRSSLAEDIRARSAPLLATALVHAVDLERQAKQAHWNVRGPDFIALHELFDRVAEAAVGYTDLLAERLVSIGGVADATVQTVAGRTTLAPYPGDTRAGPEHLGAVAGALATFGGLARTAID